MPSSGPLLDPPQSQNTSRYYVFDLLDADGEPARGFTGLEGLTTRLWPGDDTPSLWTSTTAATWITASPPVVQLYVPSTALAAIPPGTYRLQVIAAPGLTDTEVVAGSIEVVAAPDTGLSLATAITLADLQQYAPWIARVQDLAGTQAGFSEARAEAYEWLKGVAVGRYLDRAEYQRRIGGQSWPSGVLPTGGLSDQGPGSGPSALPDAGIRDAAASFRDLLDAGGLMFGGVDSGRGKRAMSFYALSLVMESQIGSDGSPTAYQAMAPGFRSKANREIANWIARVDANDDGIADYELE